MTKVLLDTNIVIDLAQKRMPFFTDTVKIFKLINDKKIAGYVSATAATDIFYILQKTDGKEQTLLFLKKLFKVVDIICVDKLLILKALYSGWNDFEDAVQAQVAVENQIDMIITRNTNDFEKLTDIKVISPEKFIIHNS